MIPSSYLALSRGELHERVSLLKSMLVPCRLCPHECGVDRSAGEKGTCSLGAGMVVAASTAHFGEEPEVSGTRGSGTVFFGSCNLRCAYCQNAQISQSVEVRKARRESPEDLAARMLSLQEAGCHNINWVTPSHVVPWAVEGLEVAAGRGLTLPVVYNTSGYDGIETLRLLDGIVDVYLTDLRYSDDETAWDLSRAEGYAGAARAALLEMARQVGTNSVIGEDGAIRRGLIVRILVLPNDLAGVRESLAFVRAELGTGVRIALMSQYYPAHKAMSNPLLSRKVHFGEYARALDVAERLGFGNVLVQEMESSDFYRPDFGRGGEPFDR